MSNHPTKLYLAVYAFAWVAAGLSSAYYTYLKAPSVVAARPGLPDLGVWTALFSGRFTEWLFYTHPTIGLVVTVTAWTLIATLFILAEEWL